MLTPEDRTWLELKFDSLEERYGRSEGKVDKILNIVEGLAGKVADLDQENKMGAVTLGRHGRQIEQLASASGTTLID